MKVFLQHMNRKKDLFRTSVQNDPRPESSNNHNVVLVENSISLSSFFVIINQPLGLLFFYHGKTPEN